jgi:hypothetical protein
MRWTPKIDKELRQAIEVAQPAIVKSMQANGKFSQSDGWNIVAGVLMASSPGLVVTGNACWSRSKRLDAADAKDSGGHCLFDISAHQSALEGVAVRMAGLEERMGVLLRSIETIAAIVVDISNNHGRK